jgi:hypothetical protein
VSIGDWCKGSNMIGECRLPNSNAAGKDLMENWRDQQPGLKEDIFSCFVIKKSSLIFKRSPLKIYSINLTVLILISIFFKTMSTDEC